MIQSTCGSNAINVSPSGLEYQDSQCPVADATGNDVPPSGLIANSPRCIPVGASEIFTRDPQH